MRLLLEAFPQGASAANGYGWLPVHRAAHRGKAACVSQPLLAAPGAATAPDEERERVPLHWACLAGDEPTVALLLEAAPEAASMVDEEGSLPLHIAAEQGSAAVVQMLVSHAPAAATAADGQGRLPLQLAVAGGHAAAIRCLLAAGPFASAVTALRQAGGAAQPLFADLVAAHLPLSCRQWSLLPSPCLGLAGVLPAALARSPLQAAQVVARLPLGDAARMRTFALALARALRQRRIFLPQPLVWLILSLFDA